MNSRSVVILGSTGSIGTTALELIGRNRDRFHVLALSAGGDNVGLLAAQALEFGVEVVAVAKATVAQDLQLAFYAEAQRKGYAQGEFRIPKIVTGPDASSELAAMPCDVVLNGINGSVGLHATLAALDAGNTLALANKESLVIGGPIVTRRAKPGQIVAVDSEHSAIAQCLRGGAPDEVRKLLLTASGGPFLGRPRSELENVTVEQALAHPNFAMGPVVTINSATLVNKGLELIEAHLLFGIPMDRIDVVIHRQQAIHSMVEFHDGATIAQVGVPTMTVPIALALGWPDRIADASPPWDWSAASNWTFQPVGDAEFPAVGLARAAGTRGGTAPAVFNAANEVCVQAFRDGRLPFLAIVDTVAQVVTEHDVPSYVELSVDDVLAADAWARRRAHELTDTTDSSQENQRA
ncbi:1-deoxy-D-xylulose-5-phosphate reductoisomerase [Kribbella solani]|uniref:1-deoxy-D-xylulose-5-phosphate reductoisomerase n=1 Tax=Kribbella solani TaxID=236067 RepID=UPI0029A72446|nr:1-deoxy-D-xylulose-5-phosphate reductoisomerase [Kribbella solani]MDX2972027.1 1-deoxy-D-xylulose-5-phosphate reductoisomerase [Kribbella solani]MDX3000360.1 1-deoxy-D-xylulose-5-phosphate reductoisomerase [Kribbella solani]